MRGFVGVDLGREPALEETTVCKFRHLLERHELASASSSRSTPISSAHGVKIGTGTIVDASNLAAPWSTKNKAGDRDPKMHRCQRATSGTSA